MTDETKAKESPMEVLTKLYAGAPAEVRPYLDRAIFELLGTTMPRIAALTTFGSFMSNDELEKYKFGTTFTDAIEAAEAAGAKVPKSMTPTAREIGRELGDAIDSHIKRALITQSEDYVSRDSHMDIVAGHALVTRGIATLAEVPPGLEIDDEGFVQEPVADDA